MVARLPIQTVGATLVVARPFREANAGDARGAGVDPAQTTVFPAQTTVFPAQAGIQRGGREAGLPPPKYERNKGKCPKDKGGPNISERQAYLVNPAAKYDSN